MRAITRHLLPILALLVLTVHAHGQTDTLVYSNFNTPRFTYFAPGAASSAGGSTKLVADDLGYNPIFAGQNLSAFQVRIICADFSPTSVTPTVIFWNSDGASGGPGTFLAQYILPLQTLQSNEARTLSYAVPATTQFALPSSGKVWAGVYFTGTAGEPASQINNIGLTIFDPPTAGGSNDEFFTSSGSVPGATSNPAGSIDQSPDGGNPVANFAWSLTTTTVGTVSDLHDFTGNGSDGFAPYGALLLAADGNFYGTTQIGGANSEGTIFQLTPDGTCTTVYSFGGLGVYPLAGLIQGSDGLLYGTTTGGGTSNGGTVFQYTIGGSEVTLHSFNSLGANGSNADGANPGIYSLLQGRDGNIYGVSRQGGAFRHGTAFAVSPTGTFQVLASFGSDAASPGDPSGPLIEDGQGNFIGTTLNGGANGTGTIYQLNSTGLTLLDSLPSDNNRPVGGVVIGPDGNYYGLTTFGGSAGGGTAFLVTPGVNGTFTTIANFGTDTLGEQPAAGLLLASDGNFYGTLSTSSGDGSGIFRLVPGVNGGANFENLFASSDETLTGYLTQGGDGNLYGLATGSDNLGGNVFNYSGTIPPAVQFDLAENSVNELDGTAMVRVDRLGGTGALSVNYATSDGTATLPDPAALDGTDYHAVSGTLSWAAGDTLPKFIPVPIIDQGLDDGMLHSLTITLTNATSGTRLGAQSTSTLTINLTEKFTTITLTATVPDVTEGSGEKGIFTLTLSQPLDRDLVVHFGIFGSATNGTDYKFLNDAKTIKAGKTTKQIKILPQGDLGGASSKKVILELQPGSFYNVGTAGKVKLKILAQ